MKIYSTDNLMERKDDIALSEAQVGKIKKLHSENASSFAILKLDLDDATSKLKKMLEQPKLDQAAVSRQMDEVLGLENQMKKIQLKTLVSIKNELSLEQITKLEEKRMLLVGKTAPSSMSQVQVISSSGTSAATSVSTTTSPKIAVSVAANGAQPLYFIETKSGLKKVESLDNIDPKNIESMSVFKGEQAIEKYGKEGENGVIVIKLKDMPE